MKPSKALTIKKHEAQLRVYEEASVGEIDMYFVEGNA
jgi:hypothetical protein